jgi:hypothetical protein
MARVDSGGNQVNQSVDGGTHEGLIRAYLHAKEVIVRAGFGSEIDWQDHVRFEGITESDFLREYAWVVFSAGMRESVVRMKFAGISCAFLDWKSAADIAQNAHACQARALAIINHPGKVAGVVTAAQRIASEGFGVIRDRVKSEGCQELRALPFIGPVTVYHLAKNIGLDVVKPDRHLCRVASATGFSTASDLCQTIAGYVGDRLSVVDLVIWRFATLDREYRFHFSAAVKPAVRRAVSGSHGATW